MTTFASEWTKLWSVRSTWWALIGAVAVMLLSSVQVAFWDESRSAGDVAVDAFAVAQLAVLALAMLTITNEYSHRTMRATLQWTPARTRVLVAKAAVVAAVTGATGAVLAIGGMAAATPILTDPPAIQIKDVVTIALAATLLGLIALGLGAALRGAVLTLVVLFLLLVLLPPLLQTPDIAALNTIADLTPGPAATRLTGEREAGGALVMAVWAAAALLAGALVMKRRDA